MAKPQPHAVQLALRGPLDRTDVPGLSERVCALLRESGAELALLDVSAVEPTVVTVDALARLQLAARRHGCRVCLRNPSGALRELVAFVGLGDVLPG
jgi:ABC-type transporter Mla MlaB component